MDLEVRLSHHEVAIEQLTRQLLDREKELRLVTERLATLEAQFRASARPDLATTLEETPPPHY